MQAALSPAPQNRSRFWLLKALPRLKPTPGTSQGPSHAQGRTGKRAMAPKRKAEAPPAAAAEPPIFCGLRVVFWATKLMSVMQQRVKALGGTLEPALKPDVTHVVCAPDMSAQQAAVHLRECSGCVPGQLGAAQVLLSLACDPLFCLLIAGLCARRSMWGGTPGCSCRRA